MDHRRLLQRLSKPAVLGLAAIAVAIAACGPSAPAATDPYAAIKRSSEASYDQVRVQFGFTTSGTGRDISIPPQAFTFSIDNQAGKGAFHLALPASALGADGARSLAMLGVTGDTLELDILYDGQALYAKSPIATTVVPLLMMQTGGTVTGDLSGWLRLGTTQEFQDLIETIGQLPVPVPTPAASVANPLAGLDVATIRSKLEESGIKLALAQGGQRNGVDADHVTITIDMPVLASSPLLSQLAGSQLSQLTAVASQVSLSGDLWFDKGSGRIVEADLHMGASGGTVDLTMLIGTPDPSVFTSPTSWTDVPVTPMLSQLMQQFGGSLVP